ncbi:MAG: class I SAM-dependent methyltransferase [Polyangiaceae bacterium]
MKYRDSGMPEETYWESLFDVPLILERLGIDGRITAAVELGCGHGTFTLPVARRIAGDLHTVDIDAEMVRRTKERLADAGVPNVFVAERDVTIDGFGVPDGTQDACLLFNILHGEEPVLLLERARATLKPGGRAYVIHWRYDPTTPRGPSMEIRPKPSQCLAWAEAARFHLESDAIIDLPPYHWGMVLRA